MPSLTRRLAWLGSANFVTATGGAAVLGSAIHSIRLPFIEVGSLVAFFFGTALCACVSMTLFRWWEANTLTTAVITLALATICAVLLRNGVGAIQQPTRAHFP